MRGRGRPRGAGPSRRGPPLKVMMNMQAATAHSYVEHARPLGVRRARGRPRGSRARGRKELLLPYSIDAIPAKTVERQEARLLGPANPTPPTNTLKRKMLQQLDASSSAPVVKRRRKELQLDSDDEFSDVDIGSLIPHSYHKGSSEDHMSRVERCRLCDKPAMDSTPLDTCTSTTKIQMCQKLDKIVSADQLTLRHKQGVLCSRCSRLLNYIDRIEVELSMLKKTIVECIHKKHNLYVPDESLNFDVTGEEEEEGEGEPVADEFDNLLEKNSVKEKQILSYIKHQADIPKKNNDWDVERNSQVGETYFSEENDTIVEIPQESNFVGGIEHELEIEENGDIDMCEEYLEPMFEETVISSQEGEIATDRQQRREQHMSREQASTEMEKGKSHTSSLKQNGESVSLGRPNLHDDLDVRMLIEELTADSQEGEQDVIEKSGEIQNDKNCGTTLGKEGSEKEQLGDTDAQGVEERVDAELNDSEVHIWKMSREVEKSHSEVDQCQESDSSSESDMKKWELTEAAGVNEVTSHGSKLICYDADEWEDGDSQLLDKDVSVQAEEPSTNIGEQSYEIDTEVKEKAYVIDASKIAEDGACSDEINSEGKENEALTKMHELDDNQDENASENEVEKMNVKFKHKEQRDDEVAFGSEKNRSKLSTETVKGKIENNYEAKEEIAEVDGRAQQEKTHINDSAHRNIYDNSKDIEKTDVESEEEKMDTSDEDYKVSVEMKWSSESENEGTESDDEDDTEFTNLKVLDKVTDDDQTTAEESNTETQELCRKEKTDESNGDEVILNVESPKIEINKMQVVEEILKPLNEVDSKEESVDDFDVNIDENLFQKNDAGLAMQELDTNLKAQKNDTDLMVQESDTDLRVLELDTNLMQEMDTDLREQEKDYNFRTQNADIELKLQETDTDLMAQKSDTNVRVQETDTDLRMQESDNDLMDQGTDIDLKTQENYTDLGRQEIDSGLGAQKMDTDLRVQETDTDLRVQGTDTDLWVRETDTDLRVRETDTDLRVRERETDLRVRETDTDLRVRETDTDLRVRDTDTDLRVRETDTDLRVRETDTDLRVRETDTDLRVRETDTDLRVRETDTDLRVRETDTDLRVQEIETDSDSRVQEIETDTDSRLQEIETDTDSRLQEIETDTDSRLQEIETDTDSRLQETEIDTDSRVQETEIDTDSRVQETEIDTDSRVQETEIDTDLRVQETEIDTVLRVQETEIDTNLRVQETEIDTDLRMQETEIDTDLRMQETEIDTDLRVQETEIDTDLRMQETEIDADLRVQETDTNLGMQKNDSDIYKRDSFSVEMEEKIREEESKVESLGSDSEIEVSFSRGIEKVVNSDENQNGKSFKEDTEKENIKEEQQEKVNSVMDEDQLDTRVPAEEGDPEIEVLEFKKTEDSGLVNCASSSDSAGGSCTVETKEAETSKIIPRDKPIADMIEEHLASILAEPLGGEQGELFGMDVDSITISEKSSVKLRGSNPIVALQTDESVIRMLEEPVTTTQGNELFADVSDEKSVIIIDEDEETDNSQSAMLVGMGLIGRPEHALSDLCGTTSDVECVDISSD